ncbi:MAG TPA: MaoC/PaaZ C-terminal domain-containing protein [Anaerolineae bacterium]|nr:MaoC/PaaZ C-terminal domain-containing protein [Anaerolineae bacterium]HNU02595.1 MaoC/PaaZ C-terminal domain-containing protein [Anaerolineae bacterium]
MTTPTFDTINVGDALPSLTKAAITEVQLVRYSGASGDFNPIHTVHQAGVESGNNGVITHGMVIMGFVGQMIANWVRPDQVRSFGVRFTGISRPGDEITVSGKVLEKFEADGEQRVRCEVEAADQTGHRKVKGEFVAAL